MFVAAVDQVVDCLDKIDCLTQPGLVDNLAVSRLLEDDQLCSILEVCWLYFCTANYTALYILGCVFVCDTVGWRDTMLIDWDNAFR